MDHVHYSQWIPIFIKDVEELDPTTFETFQKRYFTIKRSDRIFSNIAVDETHEQNNKLVKIHRGSIGIFENHDALFHWSVSTSIIADMCYDNEITTDSKHHENTVSFDQSYRKDVDSLIESINAMGNPFKETEKILYIYRQRLF